MSCVDFIVVINGLFDGDVCILYFDFMEGCYRGVEGYIKKWVIFFFFVYISEGLLFIFVVCIFCVFWFVLYFVVF